MAKKVEFNMEVAKKYVFWVCVPIGLIAAVVLGLMAVGAVSTQLEDRKKQLDSQKTAVEGLRGGAAEHPNEGTIEEINKQAEELVGKVYAGWETLEKDQKEQNRWDGLANRAIQDIASKNFLDNLEPTTLSSYQNFGQTEMRMLLDKAGISRCRLYRRFPGRGDEPLETNEPLLTSDGGGGFGGGSSYGGSEGGMTSSRGSGAAMGSPRTGGMQGMMGMGGIDVMKGKVVWNNPSVAITIKDWSTQPQSFQVWLTQEDFWVYQALLWVVAKSNADAKENEVRRMPGMTGGMSSGMGGMGGGGGMGQALDLSSSTIKEIVDMSIGRKAAMALSTYSARRISMGGGMGMDSSMGMGMGSSMGMGMGMGGMDSSGMGMGMGMGGMDSSMGMGMGMGDGTTMGAAAVAEAAKAAALMGRYVDAAGSPLMEVDLTGQFRRMPIYLCFVVVQKRISDVLVNCANCPMPIDVLWVTVNPDATNTFDFASIASSAMGGGGMMGSMGGGSSSSMRPSRASGGGSSTRSSSSMSSSRSSYDSGGGAGMGQGNDVIGMPNAAGGGQMSTATEFDFGADAVMIEIYGCINIFSPPDKQKIMGVPDAAEGLSAGM